MMILIDTTRRSVSASSPNLPRRVVRAIYGAILDHRPTAVAFTAIITGIKGVEYRQHPG
jgi:hypothetical protein